MDNTQGQSGLSPAKARRWTHVKDGCIAMEEVSMISCHLQGCMQKAAASLRPSAASLPYAGLICVTFGDLNQVRLFFHLLHRDLGAFLTHCPRQTNPIGVSGTTITQHQPRSCPPSHLFSISQLEPVGYKPVSHGAADSSTLAALTDTELMGRSNFWGANASVILDETNNRFSPTYAPIMDRLLRGECTLADVDAINSRVINKPTRLEDGSFGKITMEDCWMAQTITFRNKARTIFFATCIHNEPSPMHIRTSNFKASRLFHSLPAANALSTSKRFSQVTMALTMPTTRSLCEARGTVCYVTKASDLFISSGFLHQKKQVHVYYKPRAPL